MTDVHTLNLGDSGDGMVSLNNPSTSFIPNTSQNFPEKNISENKQTMDSTPISDIMGQTQEPLEPPMMAADPRMVQSQMQAPMMALQQPVQQQQAQTEEKKSTGNPLNLTDEQLQLVLIAACTGAAISKPVQEKLAKFVPQFLNANGNRSMVGLASTGVVAAAMFYIVKRYV